MGGGGKQDRWHLQQVQRALQGNKQTCLMKNSLRSRVSRMELREGEWEVMSLEKLAWVSFVRSLGQWPPSSLAPGTSVMEDRFSVGRGGGNGFGMTQAPCMYCAL